MYTVRYNTYDELPYLELWFDDKRIMGDAVFSLEEVQIILRYFMSRIELEERRKKDLTITRQTID